MKMLLISIALLASPAYAWQIEAGAGVTHYETENGRWYQNGQPENAVSTNSPAFSVGVVGNAVSMGRMGVDWRVSYSFLGRASASCQCLIHDEDYAARRDGPSARFSGSGNAHGVALTVEPYYWTSGLRFGLEAGAFVYHSSWSESVTGWQGQNLSLSNHSWNVAPVAGVNIGNGPWTLSYRHYFMRMNSARQNVPPVWNDADVLEIKRRF